MGLAGTFITNSGATAEWAQVKENLHKKGECRCSVIYLYAKKGDSKRIAKRTEEWRNIIHRKPLVIIAGINDEDLPDDILNYENFNEGRATESYDEWVDKKIKNDFLYFKDAIIEEDV